MTNGNRRGLPIFFLPLLEKKTGSESVLIVDSEV
jgi:hypothetical protein